MEKKWRAEVTPLEPEFLQLFQKYPQLHPTEIIDDFEPFGFRSTNVSKKFLQQKYVKDGLSASQIGSMLGFSKQTILKKLSEFNIPIREPHKPHGRYAQLPYGKRCHGGSSAPFKKELQIIQRIKNLRAQGKSLREIAQTLNLKGVPTKCKSRSGWHPQMVKRCLDSSM